MPIRRSAVVVLLLSAAVASCGSNGSASGGSGTHLTVDGVATTSSAFVPPGSDDTVPSSVEPEATEVSIAGSVTCEGAKSKGTGMFATRAVEVCLQIATEGAAFASIGTADETTCAQVYGGPQHASIKGAINGRSVDVSVTRTDGCGIADWTSLEWLLGPPER
ncbi:MAG: hypothetical protein ACXWA9_02990 [Acidimicrobiia bacterium]